jgi:O-antigen/teichoic acid export membrane protein
MLRSFLGSAGLRFVGMGFGFLVGIQLARALGTSGYGVYGYALSIISMLAIPAEFGLATLVTREVAAAHVHRRWDEIRGVLYWAAKTIAMLSVSILILGILAWLTFGAALREDLAMPLAAGVLLVAVVPLVNLCGGALRGMQRVVRGQVPEIILRPALFSAFLFVTGQFVHDLTPAIALSMQVAAAALTLLVAYLMLRSMLPPAHVNPGAGGAGKGWLKSAVPLALTESMRAIQGNLSVLALGVIATSHFVGIFRVGASTALILSMPITVAHVVSGPMFSRLHAAGDRAGLQRYLTHTTVATVGGVLVCLIPFAFFGRQLLGLAFGHDFGESNAVVLILTVGTAVGASFGPGATLLNMTGHERLVTRSFAVSLLLMAVLTPPLILIWGGEGAAVANSVSFIAWSAMMWRHAKRNAGVDPSVWSIVSMRSL